MTIASADEFVERVMQIAQGRNHPVAINRDGLRQIDFGHKTLHEGHLRQLYPDILDPTSNISELIEKIAPGRPCTHKPMKEIVALIKSVAQHVAFHDSFMPNFSRNAPPDIPGGALLLS